MKPYVEGPISIGWMESMIRKPRKLVTFMARGTFELVHGAPCRPLEKPDDLTGDLHIEDDPARALLYPSDFTPLKPCADLVLSGSAFAPGGRPAPVVSISFGVGAWKKALVAVGDREMSGSALARVSEPQPFVSMPLSWERAFGGPGSAANPVGTGAAAQKNPDGRKVRRLPNVETLDGIRSDAAANRPPAGFGPIPWTWPRRTKKAGSYGGDWLEKHWPAFPPDLDPAFFNAAPEDQQWTGYLKGDEPLRLENLHRAYPILETCLPGLRVRCFYAPIRGSYPSPREVPLNLDTLVVDTDRGVVNLVWRGAVEFDNGGPLDDDCVLFATEELRQRPFDPEYYRLLLNSLYASKPRPPRPGTPAQAAAVAPAAGQPGDTGQPGAVAPAAGQPGDVAPSPGNDSARPAAPDDPAAVEGSVAADNPAAAALLGFDVAEEEEAEEAPIESGEPPPPPPPPTGREIVLERMSAGESLAGSDLAGADLSGMDLAGIDLSGANLSGARLVGAKMSKAVLEGTILAGADLTGAGMTGAILTGADCSDAVMNGVDLSGANLEEAILSRARLRGARFEKATASRAFFDETKMADADFSGAVLVESYFTAARMSNARFDRADLSRSNFERAWGRKVSFDKANLTELRAAASLLPEASFTATLAVKSIWQKANLVRSRFSEADFRGSEFEAADLRGCLFERTEFRQARFVASDARGLRVIESGLFRTNFEKADVREAAFASSNLFESSFVDAVAQGAVFDRCNLGRAMAPVTR